MKDFQHPNVMSLIGVCLDAGPGVSIVMPFMVNGSLLEYLKKERVNLYLTEIDEIDEVKFAYGVHDAREFVISIKSVVYHELQEQVFLSLILRNSLVSQK